MSQTSSGSGGSAAPGWYTDPHDPTQLRWWSGEGWTEHTSPQSQPAAQSQETAQAQQDAAQAAAAQQAAQQAAAQQAAAEQAAAQQAAAQQAAAAQAAQQAAAQQAYEQQQQSAAADAFPSRRALRDPADEAAEAAAAQQQQLQQEDRPLTFLEKQGYPATPGGTAGPSAPSAPAAPAQPNAWNQPVQEQQPAASAPVASVPSAQVPSVQVSSVQVPPAQVPSVQVPSAQQPTAQPTNAWDQPVQLVEPAAPQQPVQAGGWTRPVQDAAAAAVQGWGQPAAAQPEAAQPTLSPAELLFAQGEVAQQNAAQQNFGLPGGSQQFAQQPVTQQPASDGLDSLFGGVPAAAPAEAYAQQPSAPAAGGWGLTPSSRAAGDGAPVSRSSDARGAQARPESSGTLWSWLAAISPILAAGAIGYVLSSVGTDLGWQIGAAVAAPYLLVVLFAVADQSALKTLGIEKPATWAFALLTAPIYLLMRASVTRAQTGTGNGPLIAWFIALIVAAVGFVGVGVLTGSPLYPGLPG